MNDLRTHPASSPARWLLILATALVVAFTLQGAPASARQVPPDLEAVNDRLIGLFEINGVVFTDADETTGRLVVGVSNPGLAKSVEKRLDLLDVSPQDVDIVVSPPIYQLATLQDRVRPLAGGLQIRFDGYLCTLGFNAVLGGVQGFVTNSHCTNTQGGVEGTQYYQPLDQISNDFIGTEVADPAYSGSTCNGEIFPVRNLVCRWSDSAFVRLTSPADADFGYIQKTTAPNLGPCPQFCIIDGQFRIISETTLGVDDIANKVGRTTGWTQSPVTRTCVHTGVSGTRIIQLCQTFIEAPGQTLLGSGDSGSPVFQIVSGNEVNLAGLLWGGSSDGSVIVYSPLANIENQLSDTELGPLETVASGDPEPNVAPVASASGPYTGSEDSAIGFDGSNSTDGDDDALTYSWDFGDGNSGSGVNPSHTYAWGGTFTIDLTVDDGHGGTDTDSTTVTVTEVNDIPVADPGGPYTGTVGSSITFDGSASSDFDNLDGAVSNNQPLTYVWDFDNGATGTGVSPDQAYAPGTYTVTLTVNDGIADSDPVSTTVTVFDVAAGVTVDTIDPSSMPRGGQVTVGIDGSGFVEGAVVSFESGACGPAPSAAVTSLAPDHIVADVTHSGGGPRNKSCGGWDVRVTNPDGSTDVLPSVFTVTP